MWRSVSMELRHPASAPSALDSVPRAFCSFKSHPSPCSGWPLALSPLHSHTELASGAQLGLTTPQDEWIMTSWLLLTAHLPEEEATGLLQVFPFVKVYPRPLLKQAKNIHIIICLQWILSPAEKQPWEQLAVYFCEVTAKKKMSGPYSRSNREVEETALSAKCFLCKHEDLGFITCMCVK